MKAKPGDPVERRSLTAQSYSLIHEIPLKICFWSTRNEGWANKVAGTE